MKYSDFQNILFTLSSLLSSKAWTAALANALLSSSPLTLLHTLGCWLPDRRSSQLAAASFPVLRLREAFVHTETQRKREGGASCLALPVSIQMSAERSVYSLVSSPSCHTLDKVPINSMA